MGVVVRPRFGRICYFGCGEKVPTQRVNHLIAEAAKRGEEMRPSECVCVACEKLYAAGATVTRKPR